MHQSVTHHDVGASMRRTTVGLLARRLCALWKRVDVGASRRDGKASMEHPEGRLAKKRGGMLGRWNGEQRGEVKKEGRLGTSEAACGRAHEVTKAADVCHGVGLWESAGKLT